MIKFSRRKAQKICPANHFSFKCRVDVLEGVTTGTAVLSGVEKPAFAATSAASIFLDSMSSVLCSNSS